MRRFFLIPLLAFGTIAGFASGFHSLHMRHHCGWHDDWQRSAYEQPLNAPPQQVNLQQAPAPAPVTVQQAAPAPAQTLVIPIIVGVPQGAPAAAPTTYVVPVPTTVQPPAAGK